MYVLAFFIYILLTSCQAVELKDLGNKEFTSNNFEKAIDLFPQAIELDPTNHVFYSNRSGAYMGLNQCDKALADAEKTIQVNPQFAKVRDALGWSFFF